jgi:hypothetical protein
MTRTDYAQLSANVRDGLRATFSDLLKAHPDRSFYTFAIWPDGSLQFANAAANTEEGLAPIRTIGACPVVVIQGAVSRMATRQNSLWTRNSGELDYPKIKS